MVSFDFDTKKIASIESTIHSYFHQQLEQIKKKQTTKHWLMKNAWKLLSTSPTEIRIFNNVSRGVLRAESWRMTYYFVGRL